MFDRTAIRLVLDASPNITRAWTHAERVSLQEAVRTAIPKHRAATCLRHRLGDGSVNVSRSGNKTKLGGVMICGDRHICPVCHHKHSSKDHEKVQAIAMQHYAEHQLIVNCVLTVPHSEGEPLKTVLERLETVWHAFRSKPLWNRLTRELGILGAIRKLEIVLGPNGWHSHYHLLLLCNLGDSNALARFSPEAASHRWASFEDFPERTNALIRVSHAWEEAGRLTKTKVSTDAQSAVGIFLALDAEKVTRYIAKDMGYSSGVPSTGKGLTIMDLLRIVNQQPKEAPANAAAIQLIEEYASAVKGKHPLSFIGSARIAKKALYLPKKEETPALKLGTLSGDAWKATCQTGMRRSVATVCTADGLAMIINQVAHLSGLTETPAGWLKLRGEENKTVISDEHRTTIRGEVVASFSTNRHLGSRTTGHRHITHRSRGPTRCQIDFNPPTSPTLEKGHARPHPVRADTSCFANKRANHLAD